MQQEEQDITVVTTGPVRKRDDWLGRTLAGKYEVVELLGKGGMSAVYKVKHVILGKPYAVKIMHQHMVADSTALERFKVEASAAAKLAHPNIITIHDYDDEDGHPFQAIDYLEGVSLSDEIRQCGRLEPERALNIFIQACAALAHAHDMNVIHRDLKPSNIMLIEKDGVKDFVKLVDFGIAKMLPQEGEAVQQLTQTGEIFGTPLYMSPEQCLGQKLDTRSDIYSFGCLMYEAVVGHPPLGGSSVFATIQKHIDETPKSIQEELSKSSRLIDALDAIIAKTLAKQPAMRQQTMHELLNELQEAKRGARAGLLATVGRSLQILWIRLEPIRKRTPLHLLIPLMVTVSLLFVAGSFIWQWQSVPIKPYEIQAWPQFSPEAMVVGTFGQNNETLALATITYAQLRKRVSQSANSGDRETAARYELSLIVPFAKNGNYAQAASEAVGLKRRLEDLAKEKPGFDPFDLLPAGSSRPDMAQEWMFIGDACYMARDWKLAEYYYKLAADQLAGEAHHATKRLMMKLGDCLFQQGDFEQADSYLRKSTGESSDTFMPKYFEIKDNAFSEDRATWMAKVGDILSEQRDWKAACDAYGAAAIEFSKAPNKNSFAGQAYFKLALAQEKIGLWHDAELSLDKARQTCSKHNLPAVWNETAKVLRNEGNYLQAFVAEKSAVEAVHAR